jgi:hypothetical protein
MSPAVPDPRQVYPQGIVIGHGEKVVYGFDVNDWIDTGLGQSVSSVSVSAVNTSGGSNPTLTGTTSTSSGIIYVQIKGSDLTAGQTYLLTVQFNLDSNNTEQVIQQVACV